MTGKILAHNKEVVLGTVTNNDTLAVGQYPASASFVDVSDCISTDIVMRLGAIDVGDAPVMEPKCANAADGTPTVIDANLSKTFLNTDDGQFAVWTIETQSLPTDCHFLTLDVESGVTNGTLADIFYLKSNYDRPITQTASILPTDNQFWLGGGKTQAD